MTKIIRIGMDTSKNVFVLHGVDAAEQPILRRKLRRKQVLGPPPAAARSVLDGGEHGVTLVQDGTSTASAGCLCAAIALSGDPDGVRGTKVAATTATAFA